MTAMDAERVMLDTNILLSATDEYRQEHQAAPSCAIPICTKSRMRPLEN